MNLKNAKIKEKLTLEEHLTLVERLVQSFFWDQTYVPHYARVSEKAIITEFCILGIELNDEELVQEDGYHVLIQSIESNEKLLNLIQKVKETTYYQDVQWDVTKIVAFEKERLLRSSNVLEDKMIELMKKEDKRIDAETKLLKETTLFTKEQTEQLSHQNKLNEILSPEEQIQLTKQLAASGFDANHFATVLEQKITEQYTERHSTNERIDTK